MSTPAAVHELSTGDVSPTSPSASNLGLPEKATAAVSDETVNEKGVLENHPSSDSADDGSDKDAIIVTGADAALHLLPLRDDGDPALTFRSLFLASGLSCFSAVMYQIYQVPIHKSPKPRPPSCTC